MASSLRLLSAKPTKSNVIELSFNYVVAPTLVADNFLIQCENTSEPNPGILDVFINSEYVLLTVEPLAPQMKYTLTCQNSPSSPFISADQEHYLSVDGVSNRLVILGPIDDNNVIHQNMLELLDPSIYDAREPDTIINKYVSGLSQSLSKMFYDIKQVKNENYLSVGVVDEEHTRGTGPYDRLFEEGAYELVRVSNAKQGTYYQRSFAYNPFPSTAIALQKEVYQESLVVGNQSIEGIFNIEDMLLTVSKKDITTLVSIRFTINSMPTLYNVDKYGYQLFDGKFDERARSNKSIETNQIIINDNFFLDAGIDKIDISAISIQYEYKNHSLEINADSISVFSILKSAREAAPPLLNVFTLAHNNIVDSTGKTPATGGVKFVNAQTSNQGATTHPAFTSEIPFSDIALPSAAGEYAVNYSTGLVYVYGESLASPGTGEYPPVATYYYKHTYTNQVDYNYDATTRELASLPYSGLRYYAANLTFDYEIVWVNGEQFVAKIHEESMDEQVGNRLVALNSFKVSHYPITNVFRVFNSTTGEIYPVSRWSNDQVFFNYVKAPNLVPYTNEVVSFDKVSNETLFVSAELFTATGLRVFKVKLLNRHIGAKTEDCLGSWLNTSVILQDTTTFVKEIWFNRDSSTAQNYDRLSAIGEYVIDYENGEIYVGVSALATFDIGKVNYFVNRIKTNNKHIVAVDDIFVLESSDTSQDITYSSFTDDTIDFENIFYSDDMMYTPSQTTSFYQVISGEIQAFVDGNLKKGVRYRPLLVRALYEHDDLVNNPSPINFASHTTINDMEIFLTPISKSMVLRVSQDQNGTYVEIPVNIQYLSQYITYTFTAVRISDGANLWSPAGTVQPGKTVKLYFSQSAPAAFVGDVLRVSYSIEISGGSRVVLDYFKGNLLANYTYLADNITVSYEYGENQLDFRKSSVNPGATYYVSYKAGALRDMLYKNFATLINIPYLTQFDLGFERERYRDAIYAALSSFIQGPTIDGIKNIARQISHQEPKLDEMLYQGWALGYSNLTPRPVSLTGNMPFRQSKYGHGLLVANPGETIRMAGNSNLCTDKGSFEMWLTPQWDGLDNDALVSFEVLKNGMAAPASEIFIGATGNHPDAHTFSVHPRNIKKGLPDIVNDGVYVFCETVSSDLAYDVPVMDQNSRWFVAIKNGISSTHTNAYIVRVSMASGKIYNFTYADFEALLEPEYYPLHDWRPALVKTDKPAWITTQTGVSTAKIDLRTSAVDYKALFSFVADGSKYLLDVGEQYKNRLSLYRDFEGYLNFQVLDKHGHSFRLGHNVQLWKKGESHHIACSWRLNTLNKKDELHLFVDGFEVPNIGTWGNPQ
jgi:hypothetical protein